jgi:hypothetical protein
MVNNIPKNVTSINDLFATDTTNNLNTRVSSVDNPVQPTFINKNPNPVDTQINLPPPNYINIFPTPSSIYNTVDNQSSTGLMNNSATGLMNNSATGLMNNSATGGTNLMTNLSPVGNTTQPIIQKGDTGEAITEEETQIGEKTNPTFTLFGNEYDIDSALISIIIIIIFCLIWKITGLWKALKYDTSFTFIFLFFILYNLIIIKTSGTTSGGIVYEINILLTVEQMISIILGTMILFILFQHNIQPSLHPICREIIEKISISIMILLTIGSLWVSTYTTGRTFRALRKLKQGIYNVSLTLFIIIGLIFFKGGTTGNKGGATCN